MGRSVMIINGLIAATCEDIYIYIYIYSRIDKNNDNNNKGFPTAHSVINMHV
jgi:hypothetical protein